MSSTPQQSAPSSAQRAAVKAARRAQNKAAWAAGQVLPRWGTGQRPGLPRARTGPPAWETGAAVRKAAKDARRAANQAAWAAQQNAAAASRAAVREQARQARRRVDRATAAAWHQDRRDERSTAGDHLITQRDGHTIHAADLAAARD